MLGLSDRGATRHLLGLLLTGEARGALAALKDQYDLGVEPSALLRGLLEAVHGITRAKVGGAPDPAQSAEEREAYEDWSAKLSYAAIHRLWQLLLKGLGEVHSAPSPLEAAEMALLRVVHAAEMPDPGELLAKLAIGEASVAAPSAPASPPKTEGQPELLRAPADFGGLVALLEANGEPMLAHQLSEEFRLVDYAPPTLQLQAARTLDSRRVEDGLSKLRGALKRLFNESWQVGLAEGSAQPSLREQELESEREAEQRIRELPVVKAAFEAFPDAELAGFSSNDKRSA
jgi:DNA polymerase-3 subunit gamma/tau